MLTQTFRDPEDSARFLQTVKAAVEANRRSFSRLQQAGRWRSPCFEFTRRLRWEPRLRELSAEEAADVIEAALAVIYGDTPEELRWEILLGHNDTDGQQVDPFLDFLECWEKVREGGGALAAAVDEARENPQPETHFGSRLAATRWQPLRDFLTIAEILQDRAGDKTICLAVAPLAELLGVSMQQVSLYRRTAERYGYLETVEESYPGHATEFRFYLRPRAASSS